MIKLSQKEYNQNYRVIQRYDGRHNTIAVDTSGRHGLLVNLSKFVALFIRLCQKLFNGYKHIILHPSIVKNHTNAMLRETPSLTVKISKIEEECRVKEKKWDPLVKVISKHTFEI